MPNYCEYEMLVKGKKKDVETLFNWLRSDYSYGAEDGVECWYENEEGVKTPSEHHIGYRVFDCRADDFFNNNEDAEVTYNFFGYCAWSVYSCMFDGPEIYTYMGDCKEEADKRKAISIEEATGLLDLEVEIYSNEPGNCFAEHYYINKGAIEVSEETEFTERWVEYFDKNSESFDKEEYENLTDDFKMIIDEAIEDGYESVASCEYFENGYSYDGDFEWEWKYL